MMTVRDLMGMSLDIDVYDDVCDDIAVAFCGPMALTEEGERVWADVLDYEIDIHNAGAYPVVSVHVDGDDWRHRLSRAKDFFWAIAGYCPAYEYDEWFVEVDE